MVVWVMRVAAHVESSHMHLHTLCRAPACARLDRLWVALRNGVDIRACHAGKEAEEAAMHQALCLEAGAHISLVGAQLMLMLRTDFLGIGLTCLPALVTALTALSARAPDTQQLLKEGLHGSGISSWGSSTRTVQLDDWLLVAIGVVQGLWCWAHCHALLLAARSLSQVLTQWAYASWAR